MSESVAEKEVEKDTMEVRGEITELTMEYPKEMAVCPVCGSETHMEVHEHEKHDLFSELNRAIKDLKDKYPAEMTYCPLCGARL